MTGGCGLCTGLGKDHIGPKSTMSPWYSAGSVVHIALTASTRSLRSFQRVLKSVPWSAISSRFHPPPMPNMNRPPEMTSRLADSLAVWMGSRSMSRQMPVATRMVLLARAAAVRATNGSIVCQ